MIHEKDTVAEWLRRQTRIGLFAAKSISVSFVSAGSNPAGVAIVLLLPSDPFLLERKRSAGRREAECQDRAGNEGFRLGGWNSNQSSGQTWRNIL